MEWKASTLNDTVVYRYERGSSRLGDQSKIAVSYTRKIEDAVQKYDKKY